MDSYFAGAGLNPATINPARLLGFASWTGSIQQGKAADLVLLDADPLKEIANTNKISAVVVKGKLLRRSDLDNLLHAAEAAAR